MNSYLKLINLELLLLWIPAKIKSLQFSKKRPLQYSAATQCPQLAFKSFQRNECMVEMHFEKMKRVCGRVSNMTTDG